MKKSQSLNKQAIRKTQKKQGGSLLVMIALFLFIITFSAKTLYQSVISPSLINSNTGTSIQDWKFIWGETEKSIAGNISLWNKSTIENPISKPFGKNYLRLNYILPEMVNDTVLKITNDNFPIKVELSGKEIFNNGYGIKGYVGNRVNYITLKKFDSEQNLDIYIDVPFSFSFDADLLSLGDTTQLQAFGNNSMGLVLGLATVVLGFIFLLIALMLSIKSIKLKEMVLLGLTIIICGVDLAFNSFLNVSALLISPNFLKIQLFLDMLVVMFINLNAISVYKKVDKYMLYSFIAMMTFAGALIPVNVC